MSVRCLFGFHRPSTVSMLKRGTSVVAHCESCARPLERAADGRWLASEPLDVQKSTV
jgi:hypothetical protein